MAELEDLRQYLLINSGNIFDNELEADEALTQVINKSLLIYNNYVPQVSETIVGIWGGNLLTEGGQKYQFSAPYPKFCSAYPVYVGINFYDGIATPQSSYNSALGELRVNTPGWYRLKCSYDLSITDINQADHPLFYLVLEAQYKMSLGGMRKRFQLAETQFSADTSLYDEGKSQLDEVLQMLKDNSPIWQALGGR